MKSEKTFIIVWKTGKKEEIKGYDIADAFRKAGYGGGAIRAVDYYYEIFIVYITKYALTQGILKKKVKLTGIDGMVEDMEESAYIKAYYHGEGRDWHKTFESALAKANMMKKKKIAYLEKRLDELKKLRFKPHIHFDYKE